VPPATLSQPLGGYTKREMDEKSKKTVLRSLTYGLYVLTAAQDDAVAAGTVNWVSQASFKPPRIMVAIKADSQLHQLVEAGGAFALNVLAFDQKPIAQDFFGPTRLEAGTLNGHPYEPGQETGAPLLTELPYWLEARVTGKVGGGDHTVFVAEVINAGVRYEARPLVMWDTGWFYGG